MTDVFMLAAIEEAEAGFAEGGIPIGSVLVHEGKIIGRGHNRRVQKGSAILHGEMDAIENAGRQQRRGLSRLDRLYDAVALRDVHRHDPALRHPEGDRRRERHLHGRGGTAPLRGVEVDGAARRHAATS